MAPIHQALGLLYANQCCPPAAPANQWLATDPKPIQQAFDKAAKHLHKAKKFDAAMMADEPVKELINATFTALKKAVNTGITQGGRVTAQTTAKLHSDVYVFSGMKTYTQLKEAAGLLTDPATGGIKPYAAFERDILASNAKYNTKYLRTEYQYAATTAANAARWQKYEAQKERYHLRYLTDNGPNVRDAHRALEGTVLPVDDPFWNQYLPKNGWNCHCFVVQVKIGEHPVSDSETAQKLGETATTQLTKDGKNAGAIFRYNAGKDKVIFPPKHPYTHTRCANKLSADDDDKCKAKKEVEKQAKEALKNAVWKTHKEYDNGGVLKIHTDVIQTGDFKNVLESCEHFAKNGNEVFFYPKVPDAKSLQYKELFGELIGTVYDGKSPDFKVGKWFYEHEGHEADTSPDNWFKNMTRRGFKQASRIVIEKTNDTDHFIRRYLSNRNMQKNEKYPIEELWVKDGKEIRLVYKKAKAEQG